MKLPQNMQSVIFDGQFWGSSIVSLRYDSNTPIVRISN